MHRVKGSLAAVMAVMAVMAFKKTTLVALSIWTVVGSQGSGQCFGNLVWAFEIPTLIARLFSTYSVVGSLGSREGIIK